MKNSMYDTRQKKKIQPMRLRQHNVDFFFIFATCHSDNFATFVAAGKSDRYEWSVVEEKFNVNVILVNEADSACRDWWSRKIIESLESIWGSYDHKNDIRILSPVCDR